MSNNARQPSDKQESIAKRILVPANSIVTESQAGQLLKQENAADVAQLLVDILQYPESSHDWTQQWEIDYYTNGVTELMGTSLALPSAGDRQKYTASQLAAVMSTMKFALTYYRGQQEGSTTQPNDVRRLLTELQEWPSASRPLLSVPQLACLDDYISRIFGNSFVRELLRRPLFETPYRLEWKINRPLTLRDVSPEPPPERKPPKKAKKARAKPKKRGKGRAPTPPEDPTHEVGVQCRLPGYLPLRLAAPFPLLYELYTGQVYDEEEMSKKRKGKRK